MVKRIHRKLGVITLIIFLCGGAFQPALAQEELGISLAEALQMAVVNPYNLGAIGAAVTEAEAKVVQGGASRWPSASFSSNYTRVGPHTTVDMISMQPVDKDASGSYSTGVNIQLPVYMGGKLTAAGEMASLGLEAAEVNHQAEYVSLIYRVIQAYIGVLKADGMLALTQEQIKLLMEHEKLITTNLELGYATKSDLMETKIRVTQAELGAVKVEHGKKLALENLCNLLGIPSQELVLTSKPVLAKERQLPSLEQAISRAEAGRSELKNLELAVDIADENLKLSSGYWKPNLMMIGSYGTQNQDQPTFEDAIWSFTLNLDWKFFDAGAGKAGVKEAQANLEKLQFQLAQVRDLIRLETRQKYLAVTEAAQVLALTELSLDQALENYEIIKVKFELGVATNLELLTAQNTLNTVMNDSLNAEYDYYLAVSDLYQAMGETEKFLLEVSEDA
jgi:outer membrane protein TolC